MQITSGPAKSKALKIGWGLPGGSRLREPTGSRPGTARGNNTTLLSFIFPIPSSQTQLTMLLVSGADAVDVSLLGKICCLFCLSVTSLSTSWLSSVASLGCRVHSQRRLLLAGLQSSARRWPPSHLKFQFSRWPVLIEAESITYRQSGPCLIIGWPPLLTWEMKMLFTLRYFLRVVLKSWALLKKEINVNYIQTLGIEKKI